MVKRSTNTFEASPVRPSAIRESEHITPYLTNRLKAEYSGKYVSLVIGLVGKIGLALPIRTSSNARPKSL